MPSECEEARVGQRRVEAGKWFIMTDHRISLEQGMKADIMRIKDRKKRGGISSGWILGN